MTSSIPTSNPYQAVLPAPFAAIGVVLQGRRLARLDLLPADTPLQAGSDPMISKIGEALQRYWQNPNYRFNLPLAPQGTPFRLKVWQALAEIPPGRTVTYGELAKQLDSSPRAVGQALGDNPLPIVVPCHRVVAAGGGLGGFNHSQSGYNLDSKRWLLRHEGVL